MNRNLQVLEVLYLAVLQIDKDFEFAAQLPHKVVCICKPQNHIVRDITPKPFYHDR